MTGPFTAACIQNEAVADMDASIEQATALVRAARGSLKNTNSSVRCIHYAP